MFSFKAKGTTHLTLLGGHGLLIQQAILLSFLDGAYVLIAECLLPSFVCLPGYCRASKSVCLTLTQL